MIYSEWGSEKSTWTKGAASRGSGLKTETLRCLAQLETGGHLRFFVVTENVQVIVLNSGLLRRNKISKQLR